MPETWIDEKKYKDIYSISNNIVAHIPDGENVSDDETQ